MTPILFFVIPCYYDENVLPVTGPLFLQKLLSLIQKGEINEKSRIVFVNDGSIDATWTQIEKLHAIDAHCIGLNLSHNVGEQNALLAGLFYAETRADVCITMDSDLQDDLQATDQMVRLFRQGKDLVFGVRKSRKEDSFLERITSKMFYYVMQLVEKNCIPNHSNFRLMSKTAVEKLSFYFETDFFLPVLTASFDLPSAIIYYDRLPRAAGRSGYNFRKRLQLGLNAIISHIALQKKHPRKSAATEIQIQEVLE